MSDHSHEETTVEVRVQLPHFDKLLAARVTLGTIAFENAFKRLPRCREIDPVEAAVARQQIKEREQAFRIIADHIVWLLMKTVRDNDTVNGYEPDEWAKMHPPPASQANK